MDYASLAQQLGGTAASQPSEDETPTARRSGVDYAALAQKLGGSVAFDPTEGMSGVDKFSAGAGKVVADTFRDVKQLLGIGDQRALQADIDERKRLDQPLMDTGAGLAGNVAGNIGLAFAPGGVAAAGMKVASKLPALARAGEAIAPAIEGFAKAHPLMATAAPGVATGAILGAAQPVASDESRSTNILEGGAAGALGAALPRALSRIVQPQTGADAASLIEQGVRLTPGRTLGGAAKRIEEGFESIPIVGDAIRGANRKAVEDFNRAAYNRALDPIGSSAGKDFPVGHAGIELLQSKLGDAYNQVLGKIKRVDLDDAFQSDLGKIGSMVEQLPDDVQKQFVNIVRANIGNRMTPAGTMSADTMKIAESELGRAAKGYRGSQEFDKRQLGDAIGEVQAALRSAVGRSAPEFADELQAVNKGYANFVRIQDAASRQGSKGGVFSPNALLGAARKSDASVRKGTFAKGGALMQDLAEQGSNVLGSTVPDSGTPFRLLATLGGTHAAGAMLGGPLAAINPGALAAVGAGALPYTSLGGRAMLAALAKRPSGASRLSELLNQSAALTGTVAAGMGLPRLNSPE